MEKNLTQENAGVSNNSASAIVNIRQRCSKTVILFLFLFFLMFVISGLYGYLFIPEDGIEVYHLVGLLLFVALIGLYLRADIVAKIDFEQGEVRVYDNGTEILRAKCEEEFASKDIRARKLNLKEVVFDRVPKKYRYNIVVLKPKFVVFNMFFLKLVK